MHTKNELRYMSRPKVAIIFAALVVAWLIFDLARRFPPHRPPAWP